MNLAQLSRTKVNKISIAVITATLNMHTFKKILLMIAGVTLTNLGHAEVAASVNYF